MDFLGGRAPAPLAPSLQSKQGCPFLVARPDCRVVALFECSIFFIRNYPYGLPYFLDPLMRVNIHRTKPGPVVLSATSNAGAPSILLSVTLAVVFNERED